MTVLYILLSLALLLLAWASYALWKEPVSGERCALCGGVGDRSGEKSSCPECGVEWEE